MFLEVTVRENEAVEMDIRLQWSPADPVWVSVRSA